MSIRADHKAYERHLKWRILIEFSMYPKQLSNGLNENLKIIVLMIHFQVYEYQSIHQVVLLTLLIVHQRESQRQHIQSLCVVARFITLNIDLIEEHTRHQRTERVVINDQDFISLILKEDGDLIGRCLIIAGSTM